MNRNERLHALVEELRAAAPTPRSTRWLAERFAVSVRTIERDATALAAAGAPVYPVGGRQGGYAADTARELPPLSLTAEEAVAVSVGLTRLTASALRPAAESALDKLRSRFPGLDGAVVAALTEDDPSAGTRFPSVPAVLQEALRAERVLHLDYADQHGAVSHRTVEPIGFYGTRRHWLLLAWCRTRHGIRAFRLDRIRSARQGTERVRTRRDLSGLDLPALQATVPTIPQQTRPDPAT